MQFFYSSNYVSFCVNLQTRVTGGLCTLLLHKPLAEKLPTISHSAYLQRLTDVSEPANPSYANAND